MNDLKNTLGLRRKPQVFTSVKFAFSFADGCSKPHRVMLGAGKYLVVTPSDAAKLERAGFEFAARP